MADGRTWWGDVLGTDDGDDVDEHDDDDAILERRSSVTHEINGEDGLAARTDCVF